jgi:phospholipase/carboxylesterase
MRHLFFYLAAFISPALPAQVVKTSLIYKVHAPAAKSANAPVLILLHGYGSNEADLLDLGVSLHSGFLVFSLRAPIPLNEGRFCWFPIQFLPGGKFNYGYKEAMDSRGLILSFISNACRAYHADSTQVYLLGFSQGAMMSYEISLYSPRTFKGVIALSGRMMEETMKLHPAAAQLQKVAYFIGHGTNDGVVNVYGSSQANEFLKEKKVRSVTCKTYEMEHTIGEAELADLRTWVAMERAGN